MNNRKREKRLTPKMAAGLISSSPFKSPVAIWWPFFKLKVES
jgi:hypothetical protein